jgi:oligopeptidase A
MLKMISETNITHISYWSERQSEKLFGFTDEELRPYFALPSVMKGLFGVVNKLFGVVIKEVIDEQEGKAETWHDDVKFFKIFDEESGKHIASFFMDLYSRPATKKGGAWMADCLGKSSVIPNRDIPVAYLVCNGTPPLNGKPSLMTFGEGDCF